jgi:hypothetical protein
MAVTCAIIALPGYTRQNTHLEQAFRGIDRFSDSRRSRKSLLLTGERVLEIIPNQLATLEFPRTFVK